jgi:hypothetical protein
LWEETAARIAQLILPVSFFIVIRVVEQANETEKTAWCKVRSFFVQPLR